MAKIKLQCEEHKTYHGLAAPRFECIICWKIYATRLRLKLKEKK